jgi:beta-glucanase (GH16 family)
MKHLKEMGKCFQAGIRRRCMVMGIVFFMLTIALFTTALPVTARSGTMTAQAATVITSMSYFSPADGPVIAKSGVDKASFGFVMPVFNGGNATWEEVTSDLTVRVKVNGNWVDIDSSGLFTYNVNWGHWNDSGFYGYWFTVSQTTYLQLASKASGVTLDYTLEFTNINRTTITSMTATQGPQITAGVTGGAGFTYPVFNGDAAIPYSAVAEDLKLYVKPVNSSEWIDIDNNAASGWIYDYNFGQFTDGGGGYWFTVEESTHVKLQSKTSSTSLIYTITYNEPVRNSFALTPYDGTNYKAGDNGAIGVPLPKIDGNAAVKSELGNFVYEIKVNGAWVDLSDTSKSSFQYSGNGYNQLSAANQWGYWVDYIYGLWFQPIQTDMELRIGYPLNGQKGGTIGNNYVTYTFIGNPNAPRPDVSDMDDIELGTSENSHINGMNLIWSDEFSGTSLNTSAWNYDIGYYLNDDPNTWGWGNNELEHYTSSERNVYVRDGSLHITALEDPKSFPQDPNRYAPYSSGKITTKDKFTFQYGRIDFRAKLPRGNGLWPALWLLPNDNAYGVWAASGEIDVMEARGRIPGASSGAIHYGGQWPANTYLGGDYVFPEGQTIDSDYHVYSLVWEEDNIKWYVDGKFFFKATSDQWYSNAAPGNPLAPFDQEFYIIMNLAVGGWFDGGVVPSPGDIPATMQVDYVRVYKEGDSGNPGNVPATGVTLDQTIAEVNVSESLKLNASVLPVNATDKTVSWTVANSNIASVDQTGKVTGLSKGTTVVTVITADGGKTAQCQVTVKESGSTVIVIGDSVRGLKKIGNNLEFYVNGAEFADLHYRLNNGVQMNVAMNTSGNRNYTYPLTNLKQGDVVEYFFTYNPGGGALDTPVYTYIHGVTQGNP